MVTYRKPKKYLVLCTVNFDEDPKSPIDGCFTGRVGQADTEEEARALIKKDMEEMGKSSWVQDATKTGNRYYKIYEAEWKEVL